MLHFFDFVKIIVPTVLYIFRRLVLYADGEYKIRTGKNNILKT